MRLLLVLVALLVVRGAWAIDSRPLSIKEGCEAEASMAQSAANARDAGVPKSQELSVISNYRTDVTVSPSKDTAEYEQKRVYANLTNVDLAYRHTELSQDQIKVKVFEICSKAAQDPHYYIWLARPISYFVS